MSASPQTLSKDERMYGKKIIDALFQGGQSHALSAFPIRAVYMAISQDEEDEDSVMHVHHPQILISVPKRYFKRAVKRNTIKRLIREGYRKNKAIIAHRNIAIAFIWLEDKLRTSEEVEKRIVNLLKRINERMKEKEDTAI